MFASARVRTIIKKNVNAKASNIKEGNIVSDNPDRTRAKQLISLLCPSGTYGV